MTKQTLTEAKNWLINGLNRADDSDDVKAKGEVYIRTPWEICEDMVKSLVTACGGSLAGKTVLVVDTVEYIPVILLQKGADSCKITFVAPYTFKGKMAHSRGARVINSTLLTWKPDMKFDIIVGNPPYQGNGNNGSHGKWQKFFGISADLCEEDGHVALITPHWHAWACPSGEPLGISKSGVEYERSSGKDYKIFSSGKIEKLVLLKPREYFTEGSTFCWTHFSKGKLTTETNVTFEDGTESIIDFSASTGLPSSLNPLTLSIYKKIFSMGTFNFCMDHQTININSENYRDMHSADYPFKWIYSAGAEGSRYRWIKAKSNNYDKFKVLIPISAAGNAYKYASVETGCNQSQDLPVMIFDTEDDAKLMLAYLKLPFIDKIFRINTGTTKHGKIILPKIDINRAWSDAELYAYFGLTQEEINYIKETTK